MLTISASGNQRDTTMPQKDKRKYIFSEEDDAIVRSMFEQGEPLWKIEDALGITWATLARRIRELGLKRPPGYNRYGFYGSFTHKGRS